METVTVIQYLGGYISDAGSQAAWLGDNGREWAEGISTVAGVLLRHPQATYTCLRKSLHQEWDFFQRVTQGLGDDFRPVEMALRAELLLDLFLGEETTITVWDITGFPVKHYGLAKIDPTLINQGKWTALCVVT